MRLLPARSGPGRGAQFDIQAGRVPPDIRRVQPENLPVGNILIGYPARVSVLTSLRADALPMNANELLAMRGRGGSPIARSATRCRPTAWPLCERVPLGHWRSGCTPGRSARRRHGVGDDRHGVESAVQGRQLGAARSPDASARAPVAGLILGASAARPGSSMRGDGARAVGERPRRRVHADRLGR